MNKTHTRIEIGLQSPFRALQLTDSHIALADGRNDERKRILAAKRKAEFDAPTGDSLRILDEQLDYARKNQLPVLYTGDFCDFVSYRNLEYAREKLEAADCFFCVGNHEFSLYVGEAFEDVPYKMQSYALVQSYFKNHLLFDSRVIGGVNFVAVDDGYYRFDARQLEQMKAEVAKGLPIVLMLHNPLHTDELFHHIMRERKAASASLVGTPEKLMADYDAYRYRQQRPDADTLAFMDYIYSQPAVRAVLSGHLHFDFETRLPSGVMQYVTGAGYFDCAREIEFV